MMSVDVGDLKISYTFGHEHNELAINRRTVHAVTCCQLIVNGVEYHGMAACVMPDKFVKETGRKLALQRAMQAAQLPREVRAVVRTNYFNRGAGRAQAQQ